MKEVYHKSVREISDEFEDYVCLFFVWIPCYMIE